MQSNLDFKLNAKEDSLDKAIVQKIELLCFELKNYSLKVIPYSNNSLAKLADLSVAKKQEIYKYIGVVSYLLMGQLVSPMGNQNPEPYSDVHPEKNLVDKALKFYKLRLKDDFWSVVKGEDIIEIYTVEGLQIFRTFNFFKTCNYSLLDLLVNEWYVLWERPTFVINSLFEYQRGVKDGEHRGIVKLDIPTHIVKEVYAGEADKETFVPRTALVSFGYLTPLYDEQDEIAGIIMSCTAELNTLGTEDTQKVRFL